MMSDVIILRVEHNLFPVVLSNGEAMELVFYSIVEHSFLVVSDVVDSDHSTLLESHDILGGSVDLISDFNASLDDEEYFLYLLDSSKEDLMGGFGSWL